MTVNIITEGTTFNYFHNIFGDRLRQIKEDGDRVLELWIDGQIMGWQVMDIDKNIDYHVLSIHPATNPPPSLAMRVQRTYTRGSGRVC